MSRLGNIIWVVCGGFITAFLWYLASLVMVVTIIGIPWARACFVIANFTLCPFGRALISREELYGKGDLGTGFLGFLGNVVWFVFAGWWLALAHVTTACAAAVTIIGIPFALQHLKLAAISLSPIGKTIVKTHVAEAARLQRASAHLDRMRGQTEVYGSER